MPFRPKSATILRSSGFHWAEYAPHPALAAWVTAYWTLETLPGKHVVRSVPDACIDLTVRLGSRVDVYLTGAQTRAQHWPLRGRVQLVGARLAPGAGALLGVDASRLREDWTPLAEYLPRPLVARLLAQVVRARDMPARVQALDGFLSERLLNEALDPRLSRAIGAVFAASGAISVAQLAARSGAHARTLGRLFGQAVGLSPKRFARIVRLQAAIRQLPERVGWARIAQELGYHDQAHFIHDVRELCGATPRELVRLTSSTR